MLLNNIKQGLCNYLHSDVFNVSVADPKRKSVTIEGLQENHEYAFSVSALTRNGPGQPVSIIIRTRINCELHKIQSYTIRDNNSTI